MLMISCLALMALGSCQKNGIVYPQPDPEVVKQYMTIDELVAGGVDAPGVASQVVVKMADQDNWTVQSDSPWCVVSPTAGSAYSILTLTVGANPYDVTRTAKLTFAFLADTLYSDTQVVVVRQAAANSSMSFNPSSLSFALGGETLTAVMTTNASSWTAEVIDDATGAASTWCRVDQTSGAGNYTFNITADANGTGVARSAKLNVTSSSGTESMTIQQSGALAAVQLTLDKGDQLKLTWNDIDGEDGYTLHIYDGPDKATATQIQTYSISKNVSSLDMTSFAYTGGYVGMVYFEIEATATVNGSTLSSFSNIVGGHNYFDDATASATGAVGSEFIITNRRHLNNVRLFLDKNFKQQADIDMTGYAFLPLGAFTGSYDAGKGSVADAATGRTSDQWKISNLTINQPGTPNTAMFTSLSTTAIVRNVKLEDPSIGGGAETAGIAGTSAGTIVSCQITSTAAGNGAISSNSSADAGGIVGVMTGGSIAYCTNAATVSGGASGTGIGGIVGRNATDASLGSGVSIDHCYNFGNVDGNTQIGGIVGEVNASGTLPAGSIYLAVTYSYNTGLIKAVAANSQCGGIIGRVFVMTTVRQCYNKGAILTQGTAAAAAGSAGGIVGRIGAGDGLIIENCYNRGDVSSVGTPTVAGNGNAGGILAASFSTASTTLVMKNCYNSGTVFATTNYSNGLYSRRNTSAMIQLTMNNCVALDEDGKRQTSSSDGDIAGAPASAVYVNLSAAAMGSQASYDATWQFGTVWEMGSAGLPKLVGLPE